MKLQVFICWLVAVLNIYCCIVNFTQSGNINLFIGSLNAGTAIAAIIALFYALKPQS